MNRKMPPDIYVLVSPSNVIVRGVYGIDKDDACAQAYNYLSNRYKWPTKYWKKWKWDGFIAERERRGWRIKPAMLKVCDDVK